MHDIADAGGEDPSDMTNQALLSFGKGAKVLLTGPPGVGKSTVMQRVLDMQTDPIGGVLCLEKRAAIRRSGFIARLSNGSERDFMEKRINGYCPGPDDKMVGKYVVDIAAIEEFIVPELERCLQQPLALVYVDEIGRAQAHSSLFMRTVRDLFHADMNILATVVEAETPWSLEFKYSPQSWVIPVTVDNRDKLPSVLRDMLRYFPLYDQLSRTQQVTAKTLFFHLLQSGKWVSAQKLFSNALVYVVESRVEQLSTGEEESTATYRISGTTGCHLLQRDLSTGNFICDCDLSNCRGKFKDFMEPQTCSHELCVLITGEFPKIKKLSS